MTAQVETRSKVDTDSSTVICISLPLWPIFPLLSVIITIRSITPGSRFAFWFLVVHSWFMNQWIIVSDITSKAKPTSKESIEYVTVADLKMINLSYFQINFHISTSKPRYENAQK